MWYAGSLGTPVNCYSVAHNVHKYCIKFCGLSYKLTICLPRGLLLQLNSVNSVTFYNGTVSFIELVKIVDMQ